MNDIGGNPARPEQHGSQPVGRAANAKTPAVQNGVYTIVVRASLRASSY